MKVMLFVGKLITLLFWVCVIASLFSVFPDPVSTLLGWGAVGVLVLHLIEVSLFSARLSSKSIEPKLDKMMILVFGVFHLLPLLLEEQARLSKKNG
ncbi:MAG: DUF1145 domain-containing protein [Hahellaceae bacterium]|nr:DUF1145 domain-containing protein [Hahellaceae bacterium]MCP5169063.1 DUF1145 domain-containing protein [Hahellaceae bacterium]